MTRHGVRVVRFTGDEVITEVAGLPVPDQLRPHVAGFAVGFLIGLALGPGREPPRPVTPYRVVPYRPG